MKKKSLIIIASVIVVCILGLVASLVFDWPTDPDGVSGNIGKSSRFSRRTAGDGISNMQELMQNDEEYKNSVVAAYYIMETRTKQFDALVDMSNEAAGNIDAFAGVLKELNETKPIIDNVCALMVEAGNNLNTALGGEPCSGLAESVTNSALAYTTLQKQNRLADKFIEVADNYLKESEGTDELKYVRDQWVDYQQMTAKLEKDDVAAAKVEEKGHLLSSEQTLALRSSFSDKIVSLSIGQLDAFEMDTQLSNVMENALNWWFYSSPAGINETLNTIVVSQNETLNGHRKIDP